MKDLVERVAKAVLVDAGQNPDELWIDGRPIWKLSERSVTTAIRAVLEHFSEPGNISDAMSVAAVVKWQNDESGGSLQDWLETAIASAMRAALEGFK